MIIIDAASMVDGALIFAGGFLLGKLNRKKKGYKSPKIPKPVCGCAHHFSFHDPETKACHGMMDGDPVKYNEWDRATAWEQIPCTCRQYSGPEPLPEFYPPEITA